MDRGIQNLGLSTTQQRLQRARGILSFGYDRHRKLLEIVFSNGSAYVYEGVPEAAVRWLEKNRDPAGFLRRFITTHYRYHALRSEPAVPPAEADLEGLLKRSLSTLRDRPGQPRDGAA